MSTRIKTVFIGREMEVDREELLSQLGENMPDIKQDPHASSDLVSSDLTSGEYETSVASSPVAEETPHTRPEDASDHGLVSPNLGPKPKPTRKAAATGARAPVRRSGRVAKPRTTPQIKPTPKAPRARQGRKARGKIASNIKATAAKAGGHEWEVEAIVDSRIDADTFEHFYEVKWKGYSSKENTWERKAQLTNCMDAIRVYEKKRTGSQQIV